MRYGMSAAALVIQNRQILLVNHRAAGQYDFWLPPGGRLEGEESIFECATRETFEETGLTVEPVRILYIQEFAEPDYHFCKFFILCSTFSGALTLAHREPEEDFLVDARFFARRDLIALDVRPEIIKGQFWNDVALKNPPTRYLGLERIRD
ncbi:ADP-ribose pyrophosphatase [Thermoflexales bacterium]|nr:ADP-ribose pyrophosphatase [Thermoflexales bacterium]